MFFYYRSAGDIIAPKNCAGVDVEHDKSTILVQAKRSFAIGREDSVAAWGYPDAG